MSLDLSNQIGIYSAHFVKIDIVDFEVLRMSNHYKPIGIGESDSNVYTYTNLGQLLAISDSSKNVRITSEGVSVSVSGIPSDQIALFTQQKIKGSIIEIRQKYFDHNYVPLPMPPINILYAAFLKYKGLVSNYSVDEQWPDTPGGMGTCTITLQCTTTVDLLQTQLAGRRTNPLDEKLYFPTDLAMDRVPNISGSSYNFGAARG